MTQYTRQIGIFDPIRYNHYGITIIGCGSIGSMITILTTKMGMKKIELIDNDRIEEHNTPNEFIYSYDLNRYKTTAVKRVANNLESDLEIKETQKKQTRNMEIKNKIVFSCVDTMSARKIIYKRCLKDNVKLLIDTRMGAEIFQIYTVNLTKEKERKKYESTLHTDEKAQETPCTEKTIIYNIACIGALATAQLKKVLKNEKYYNEIMGDLTNMQIKPI